MLSAPSAISAQISVRLQVEMTNASATYDRSSWSTSGKVVSSNDNRSRTVNGVVRW